MSPNDGQQNTQHGKANESKKSDVTQREKSDVSRENIPKPAQITTNETNDVIKMNPYNDSSEKQDEDDVESGSSYSQTMTSLNDDETHVGMFHEAIASKENFLKPFKEIRSVSSPLCNLQPIVRWRLWS